MNPKDKHLLGWLNKVNTRMGDVVAELVTHSDADDLPAAGLRSLGEGLADLSTALLERADEIEPFTVDSPGGTR